MQCFKWECMIKLIRFPDATWQEPAAWGMNMQEPSIPPNCNICDLQRSCSPANLNNTYIFRTLKKQKAMCKFASAPA